MAIRVDPSTRWGRLVVWLAAALLRGTVDVLGWTCRYRVVEGEARLASLLAPGSGSEDVEPPVVPCMWHERAILAAPLIKRWARGGFRVSVMISQSRDGELVSHLARWWGFDHVRASATRGGTAGLRKIYRALRGGASPIMLPDGPHGPLHHFKIGVAVLAQMGDRPVLPMAFSCTRAWRIRSWDRLFVPKPFSTILVAVGEPLRIAREVDADGLEGERQRLEAALATLTEHNDARVLRATVSG